MASLVLRVQEVRAVEVIIYCFFTYFLPSFFLSFSYRLSEIMKEGAYTLVSLREKLTEEYGENLYCN